MASPARRSSPQPPESSQPARTDQPPRQSPSSSQEKDVISSPATSSRRPSHSSPARSSENRVKIGSSSSTSSQLRSRASRSQPSADSQDLDVISSPATSSRRPSHSSPARSGEHRLSIGPSSSPSSSHKSASGTSQSSRRSHSGGAQPPADSPPQNPPLTGLTYYLAYLFLKNYEPTRPFFRWMVVHREYLKLFWRGVAISCLVYFLHLISYILVRIYTNSTATVVDVCCKFMATFLGIAFMILYNKVGSDYKKWATKMGQRSDNAKYLPAFLENTLHLTCGTLFAIGSMFFGQWFKASSVEMNVFVSLAAFVCCINWSRWSSEDSGLLDGIVAVILGSIYIITKENGESKFIRNLFLILAAGIPALKYAIIPFADRVREWIGPLSHDDQPVCWNWFSPGYFMLLVATCLSAPYYCINIAARLYSGIPFNQTSVEVYNSTHGP